MNPIESRNLQEDLLILLCFSAEHARVVRSLSELSHFDAIYRRVAEVAFNHIDRYNEPPGDALPTLTEHLLQDTHVGSAVRSLLVDLFAHREDVNAKFAVDRLRAFVRRQTMRIGLLDASELLRGDQIDDAKLDEAEAILLAALRKRSQVFEPGTQAGNPDEFLRFLFDDESLQTFPTGIAELDNRKAGPVRGGLHLSVAAAKFGKTFFLVQLGKMAILNRFKVVHISLEMSEQRIAQRYAQAFFGASVRNESIETTQLETDEMNRFVAFHTNHAVPTMSFEDENIHQQLKERVKQFPRLNRLMIKEFPTGSLSIRDLEAYLDLLGDSINFTPDIVLLDYADLMRFEGRDFRLALGSLYKELRRIAGERNLAMVTATQVNKESTRKGVIDRGSSAGSVNKERVCDTMLYLTASEEEQEVGLARIGIRLLRNDRSRLEVYISPRFESGHFALDWAPRDTNISALTAVGASTSIESEQGVY